jgi:hypothetical protein
MNAIQPAITAVSPQSASSAPRPLATADGVSITCHEGEVPPFAEEELERIYGSVFSSLAHFRIHGGAENASTYVVRKGSDITSVLLFHREGRHVRVINEWIRVDDEEVTRFADYIFNAYRSVDVISFHAVEAQIQRLPFPSQQFYCTDDSVLTLSDTDDEYLARLGKATRKNIRRYLSRLKENHPSFSYQVYANSEADEKHIRDIIRLNRIRMANKNKVSGINDLEAEKMIQLAKTKGFVGVATIDGRVCAGAVAYRFGKNYFSFVRAHDPKYDDDRLGLICGYLLISECIARGGKELHFMWGREEHKSLLLGVERNLDHLTVYRSNAHLVLNCKEFLKNACTAHVGRARLWLQKVRREENLVSRLVEDLRGVVHWVRKLRDK